jgi:hypothetical protein
MGPYLSEREWDTVHEDYSVSGRCPMMYAVPIQFGLMETSEEIYHEQNKRGGLEKVPERIPLV